MSIFFGVPFITFLLIWSQILRYFFELPWFADSQRETNVDTTYSSNIRGKILIVLVASMNKNKKRSERWGNMDTLRVTLCSL